MLTRRELLTRGTTLLVLAPILGCSSSSSGGSSCAGIDSTSTTDEFHTHTLCVPTSDLTNPPASGMTYTTSTDSMHTHTVMITQANLTAINSGQTVMVTSSADTDPIDKVVHTHRFSIAKMAFE